MDDFRHALADDVNAFIRLHDRELDATTLASLKANAFPDSLALLPQGEAGESVLAAMRAALASTDADPDSLDRLAAEYASIYLTNAYGASPYESVWLHDEHLACQQPMFELRELYARDNLRVDDWRKRYDDHFVLQFQYLAHRLRKGEDEAPLAGLGAFIDEHVGYWLPDFAARVAARSEAPFYAALAGLTIAWLDRLREVIVEVSGEPRTARAAIETRIKAKFATESAGIAPIKFIPGAGGPSW